MKIWNTIRPNDSNPNALAAQFTFVPSDVILFKNVRANYSLQLMPFILIQRHQIEIVKIKFVSYEKKTQDWNYDHR